MPIARVGERCRPEIGCRNYDLSKWTSLYSAVAETCENNQCVCPTNSERIENLTNGPKDFCRGIFLLYYSFCILNSLKGVSLLKQKC